MLYSVKIKVSDEDVIKARDYAFEMHQKQKYGDQPYFYHLEGVVQNTRDILEDAHIGSDLKNICYVVAYLHDILEDYEYTGVTLQDIEREFSPEIGMSVNFVTHQSIDTYAQYLKQTLRSFESHVVKIADLGFNEQESMQTLEQKYSSKVRQRLEKYQVSLLYLTEKFDEKYGELYNG